MGLFERITTLRARTLLDAHQGAADIEGLHRAEHNAMGPILDQLISIRDLVREADFRPAYAEYVVEAIRGKLDHLDASQADVTGVVG